jgi:hypothetical protein
VSPERWERAIAGAERFRSSRNQPGSAGLARLTPSLAGPGGEGAGEGGRPWDLQDLHFDREQYVAEIERAAMICKAGRTT